MEQLSNLLPPKVRRIIYSVLATLYLWELIFDVIPDGAQTRIVNALAVAGFGIAAKHTFTKPKGG